MRHRIKKPRELKLRCYIDRMIDINEYLSAFTLAKESNKIVDMEQNKIILNSMPNVWSKQAYVQGFHCETIN